MHKHTPSQQRAIDAELARRLKCVANPTVRWKSELDAERGYRLRPIPWRWTVLGWLPIWLGGRPVYESVFFGDHFQRDEDLVEWLTMQHQRALFPSDQTQAVAIALLIHRTRSRMARQQALHGGTS